LVGCGQVIWRRQFFQRVSGENKCEMVVNAWWQGCRNGDLAPRCDPSRAGPGRDAPRRHPWRTAIPRSRRRSGLPLLAAIEICRVAHQYSESMFEEVPFSGWYWVSCRPKGRLRRWRDRVFRGFSSFPSEICRHTSRPTRRDRPRHTRIRWGERRGGPQTRLHDRARSRWL
jgi:hypothetical protein